MKFRILFLVFSGQRVVLFLWTNPGLSFPQDIWHDNLVSEEGILNFTLMGRNRPGGGGGILLYPDCLFNYILELIPLASKKKAVVEKRKTSFLPVWVNWCQVLCKYKMIWPPCFDHQITPFWRLKSTLEEGVVISHDFSHISVDYYISWFGFVFRGLGISKPSKLKTGKKINRNEYLLFKNIYISLYLWNDMVEYKSSMSFHPHIHSDCPLFLMSRVNSSLNSQEAQE